MWAESFLHVDGSGEYYSILRQILRKPSTGNIRSWVFDSDGGWGSGVWKRQGDGWEVASNQVLADGRTATATNFYKKIDVDQFTWASRQRQIDGQDLPDTEEILVRRVNPSNPNEN